MRAAANMQSVSRSWLLLSGFLLFYVIYLLFGALVFSSIERPVEERLRHDMQVLTQEFLNRSCVNAASLELFLLKVLRANKYGVSVIGNSSGATNWDLTSSMFFANTLVTTVGELRRFYARRKLLFRRVCSTQTTKKTLKRPVSVSQQTKSAAFCFLPRVQTFPNKFQL